MKYNPQLSLRPKKMLIIALILIFIFPSAAITASGQSDIESSSIETNADLISLSTMNIFPNLDLSSGWNIGGLDNSASIELRYRNANPISPTQWSSEFGDVVSGWNILQHSMPVPSEWLGTLNHAGIECNSYIPHGAFHCLVPSITIHDLELLEVEGIMVFIQQTKYTQKLTTY